MIGITLALLSALSWGMVTVLIRLKVNQSNVLSATAVCTVFSSCLLLPLALLSTNFAAINFEGVFFFALAGAIAPGITNLLYYKGMDIVGVSVSASIFATYPMYSSIFAIILLAERVEIGNFIGIIFIISGIWIIQKSLAKPRAGCEGISRKGLIFPLLATLTMALSFIPRKYGLIIYNEPLLGAAIGFAASSIFYLLLSKVPKVTKKALITTKDLKLFWKAAAFMSIGSIFTLYALSYEDVSIVTPIMQTEPLFVLILAALFIKGSERISFKLLTGVILIIIGVSIVTM